MLNDTRWVSKFGDLVPGYEQLLPVDRSRLPGWSDQPEEDTFEFDGETRRSLRWRDSDGFTSASPAQRHSDLATSDPAAALRNLAETLELPGTASDYHFPLQHTASLLSRAGGEDPLALSLVEQLCWYDIRLALAAPEAVSHERDGKREWVQVLTFGILAQLYEREGALREALQVAQLASESFDQMHDKAAKLTGRLAASEAESP